jgi:hypothetical protein
MSPAPLLASLSQSAVSRALQRLRDMFRDDLVIRTSAGCEPTRKGERLLHELEVFISSRLQNGISSRYAQVGRMS